jgi:hypothetical protein
MRIPGGAVSHAWATLATIDIAVATTSHPEKNFSACFAAASASAIADSLSG